MKEVSSSVIFKEFKERTEVVAPVQKKYFHFAISFEQTKYFDKFDSDGARLACKKYI